MKITDFGRKSGKLIEFEIPDSEIHGTLDKPEEKFERDGEVYHYQDVHLTRKGRNIWLANINNR